MPHRVVDFFRSSTNTIENQVAGLTKKAHPNKRKRDSTTGRGSRRRSELLTTYASSEEETSEERERDSHAPPYSPRIKMGDSRSSSISADSHTHSHKEKEHGHHHRISFPGIHFGRSHKETQISTPATIDWQLESPPIIMHGSPETSTGALLSGQLFLNIKEEFLEIESFVATLNVRVTQKKPFANHCNECASQCTELKKWILLKQPLILAKGQHSFPFSVLLDGHLPASMDTPLAAIAYEFKAEAIPKTTSAPSTPLRLEKVLDVRRALPASETPHHSVRVFPPTNIKASAHYPHVIHPIGRYTLSLRLDGIAKHNARVNTIEYWKLKKLTWRLEETIRTIAPACGRHSPKIGEEDQNQKKGIVRSDTRVIGEKTLFGGWKSNYTSATDSCVELELEYDVAKHARSACDTKSQDGTEITHQLMVEMVVSQEWAPVNKPALVTHTGVGRILRMHFGTILTERGGIGISWDNEAPPIYQDVPPSPPAYSHEMYLQGDASIAELIEPLDGGHGDEPPPLFEDVVQNEQPRASSDGR